MIVKQVAWYSTFVNFKFEIIFSNLSIIIQKVPFTEQKLIANKHLFTCNCNISLLFYNLYLQENNSHDIKHNLEQQSITVNIKTCYF